MQISSAALAAIVLYLLAAVRFAMARPAKPGPGLARRHQAIALLIPAIIAHALVLKPTVFASDGVDLGIFNAASLAGWCIGIVILLGALWRRIDSLAVVILPIIALAMVLALVFPTSHLLDASTPLGLQLHIVLSIFAYALFAIATVQAIYLGVAEYKLRHHRPSLDFLPPLPTMETVLFQLTACAFVLLTISLALGANYIADIRAQHLAHKIVFSLLAWFVFASLLIGRLRFNWRGRRSIKYVIGGFILLAVGFFGSKIALELILHRV